MKKVELWADGACKGNPGIGGWGVWLKYGAHEKSLYGGEPNTTNNRMELMGVIQGLSALKQTCEVTVYTDSQYVKKGMTEWLSAWKLRSWKTADKKPVKNADLWMSLDELCQFHQVHWRWVKGHAGIEGNEKADELANLGVEQVKAQKNTEIA